MNGLALIGVQRWTVRCVSQRLHNFRLRRCIENANPGFVTHAFSQAAPAGHGLIELIEGDSVVGVATEEPQELRLSWCPFRNFG